MKSYSPKNECTNVQVEATGPTLIFRILRTPLRIWSLIIDEYERTELHKLRVKRRQYPTPSRPRPRYMSSLLPRDPRNWKLALLGRLRKEEVVDQPMSLFLRLPSDVRVQIYHEVLGATSIHILLKDRRIYGIPCIEPVSEERAWEIRCKCRRGWPEVKMTDEGPVMMNKFVYPRPGIGMMGLMLSCRLMYVSDCFSFPATKFLLPQFVSQKEDADTDFVIKGAAKSTTSCMQNRHSYSMPPNPSSSLLLSFPYLPSTPSHPSTSTPVAPSMSPSTRTTSRHLCATCRARSAGPTKQHSICHSRTSTP
ncbi:hypothetical protein K505DRAFT_47036 [Melanomma pulvis-pyrius CBS 109.77]|uniref:DUF7730 domain-containing protein n=1 Tax=Melanomma pulvis-pyrius CBS 109.77 TaxID=1314802 RepID=A0A6A6X9C1_9PLEO|nr:hypothetical protein K505DRAFT_47036 [Melanomma pulvis-pyrius CBS 109.77]